MPESNSSLPSTPLTLADFGLVLNEEIAYQRVPGGKILTGPAKYIDRDGSIACVLDGKWRSIMPDKLQRKERGPRGGSDWVPLIDE